MAARRPPFLLPQYLPWGMLMCIITAVPIRSCRVLILVVNCPLMYTVHIFQHHYFSPAEILIFCRFSQKPNFVTLVTSGRVCKFFSLISKGLKPRCFSIFVFTGLFFSFVLTEVECLMSSRGFERGSCRHRFGSLRSCPYPTHNSIR